MNIVPVACISPTMGSVCTGKPSQVKLNKDRQRQVKTLGNVNKINTKYGKLNEQTLLKIVI